MIDKLTERKKFRFFQTTKKSLIKVFQFFHIEKMFQFKLFSASRNILIQFSVRDKRSFCASGKWRKRCSLSLLKGKYFVVKVFNEMKKPDLFEKKSCSAEKQKKFIERIFITFHIFPSYGFLCFLKRLAKYLL